MNPSTYGIQLRLNAVQVLDLVEFGGRSASAFGFDTEDDEDDTKTGGMSQSTATNEDEELDF